MIANKENVSPATSRTGSHPLREIVLALVFGAVAPYLWLGAVSISAALVQAPFLEDIGRGLSPAFLKIWVLFYFFLFGFLCSFLCAALVGLTLGYLLNSRHKLGWIIFALVFLAVSVGPGLWQGDFQGVASFFKGYEMWVFLAGSALFVYIGKRWRMRRAAKSAI